MAHPAESSRNGGSADLDSFLPADSFSRGSGGMDPNLSNLAGHGWSFLPSSGITRSAPAARSAVRPAMPARVTNIPVSGPVRPRFRPPFVGPGWGGCFFGGFTSVCGANPFFFGAFGGGYCFSPYGFWNSGYGFSCSPYYGGYGYGGYGYDDSGYGYGPGPGYGYDVNGYPAPPDSSQNNGEQMDTYTGPVGDNAENSGQNPPAEVPQSPPTQIILKNGLACQVTAYWVSNGELFYRPVTGGLSHVPVDQLDLSATVEANARNGVTFKLTDHPPGE